MNDNKKTLNQIVEGNIITLVINGDYNKAFSIIGAYSKCGYDVGKLKEICNYLKIDKEGKNDKQNRDSK